VGARTPPPRRRSIGRPRLTPTRFFLALALIGSVAYVAWALTVRDASQLPMLAAGAAVLGIVFAVTALAGAVEVVRAARRGQGGRSFLAALFGGIAAMIALGCFAAALVLAELS
jgi:asparagine N-glycosylation enzyme membrane subunit Stt3